MIVSTNRLFAGSRKREASLLDAHFSALQGRLAALRSQPEGRRKDDNAFQEVERLLGSKRSWEAVSTIELALLPLLDEEGVNVELQRVRLKAKRHYVPYEIPTDEGKDLATSRAWLEGLTHDLHLAFGRLRLEAYYKQKARIRTARLLAWAVFLFFLPNLLDFSELIRSSVNWVTPGKVGYYIFTAMSAGILGAAFSALSNLESRLQGLSLNRLRSFSCYSRLSARLLAGMIGGLLVFYAIRGELLAGSVFPDLGVSKALDSELLVGWKDKSLLVIWCFMGGFSEGFVNMVLAKAMNETRGYRGRDALNSADLGASERPRDGEQVVAPG